MAITIVQTSTFVNGGLTTNPFSPVATGNLVLILLQTFPTPGVITGVTDGQGNTYQSVPGTDQASGSSGTSMWYGKNILGGPTAFTITASVGTGNIFSLKAVEISGTDASSPIDTSGGVSANSQPVGPNLTTTNPGDLLLAISETDGAGNTGVLAPWTSSGPVGRINATYFPGTTGSFQVTFTPTQTCNFASSGVAFLPAVTTNPKKNASMFLVF